MDSCTNIKWKQEITLKSKTGLSFNAQLYMILSAKAHFLNEALWQNFKHRKLFFNWVSY